MRSSFARRARQLPLVVAAAFIGACAGDPPPSTPPSTLPLPPSAHPSPDPPPAIPPMLGKEDASAPPLAPASTPDAAVAAPLQ